MCAVQILKLQNIYKRLLLFSSQISVTHKTFTISVPDTIALTLIPQDKLHFPKRKWLCFMLLYLSVAFSSA